MASKALELLMQRVTDPVRQTFGKQLHEHGEFTSALKYLNRC